MLSSVACDKDRRSRTTAFGSTVPVCPAFPSRTKKGTLLAPLYVNTVLFPPFDGAPVLAVVKQTALDDGCGPALFSGVGNGPENGLVGCRGSG